LFMERVSLAGENSEIAKILSFRSENRAIKVFVFGQFTMISYNFTIINADEIIALGIGGGTDNLGCAPQVRICPRNIVVA